MDRIPMRMERHRNTHAIACYTFIAAIGVLYLTNFVMRAFVYHDTFWELLRDFAAPLAIVSVIYAVDWTKNYSTKFICNQLPAVSMTAICAPIIAAFYSVISYKPHNDTIDINISLFAMLSMCTAPYAFKNVQKACYAIVAEALLFVLLAVHLGNNVASMVTVVCVAVTLLLSLPKLKWFIGDEKYPRTKSCIALFMLIYGVYILILLENTGVLESIAICSFGRPGLGSSTTVNTQCFAMLANAKLWGSTAIKYPMDNIFENRVFTYILGMSGWAGVFPVIVADLLMIASGIYLSCKSTRVQHYFAVSFLAIIIVQSVAYVLMCCGWDELLFPEISPFLDGGIYVNTVFLLMEACILPPKQKRPFSKEEIEKRIDRMFHKGSES